MAWTAPRTWTTGELVTAAIMNTHIRDNLLQTAPALVTTKGDLAPATGANALARLGAGADGTILVADSTQAGGMKWAVPSATGQAVGSTSGPTTTSTTYVDLTDMAVTLTTHGGDLVAILSATLVNGTALNSTAMALSLDAAAEVADQWGQASNNSLRLPFCIAYRWTGVSAASHTVKGRWKSVNGSTIQADTTLRVLAVFEVK